MSWISLAVFTARRYANAVLAVVMCLTVCQPVRPSVSHGIASKWLNVESRKQRQTIVRDSSLLLPKVSVKF